MMQFSHKYFVGNFKDKTIFNKDKINNEDNSKLSLKIEKQ